MVLNLNNPFDVLIIGGGINGCGIARDLSGRGKSVCLIEANDLASATSSASSKIIHGGLRYLEHHEFLLVRKALKEREVLLKNAPHIMWPQEFILPHQPHLRPAWMIRIGLFLYDFLAKREILPGSRGIDFSKEKRYGEPLKSDLVKGFSYYDCWGDNSDARLVVLNALDAAEKGADIRTRCRVTGFQKGEDDIWDVTLDDGSVVKARSIINATGPWANDFLTKGLKVKLVKGSHMLVPKLYDGDHAYILQNKDDRIVFAFPYDGQTLVGTTDVSYNGDPRNVQMDDQEKSYLIDVINDHFKRQITLEDIGWHYSGVRPLIDDGQSEASKVSRDYRLEFDDGLLHVLGGKITTYRVLSEQAGQMMAEYLGDDRSNSWTENAPLPGGDIDRADFEHFYYDLCAEYPEEDQDYLKRLARTYGSRVHRLLSCEKGHDFGAGLYQSEVDYLCAHEFAKTVDDILWRRTKLGLKEINLEKLNKHLKEKKNG